MYILCTSSDAEWEEDIIPIATATDIDLLKEHAQKQCEGSLTWKSGIVCPKQTGESDKIIDYDFLIFETPFLPTATNSK